MAPLNFSYNNSKNIFLNFISSNEKKTFLSIMNINSFVLEFCEYDQCHWSK